MILIIGLGNPGEKYKNTRHNIGFRIIDEFQKKNNFPDFRLGKKFNAEISEEIFDGKKNILAKPQVFMNNSGQSVKKLSTSYKLQATSIFVIHDDIDLPVGKIRISKGSGSAGHKGVESIIKELKTKDFARVRIGIQPINNKVKNIETFVLQKFSKDEEKILKEVIEKTVEAIELILKEGLERAMNKYNN